MRGNNPRTTLKSPRRYDDIRVVIRATARKGTPTARWGRKARGPSWSAQLPRSGSARSRASFTGLTSSLGGTAMLARLRKAMDEKEQGFTLIELLVVMIIIGILAAIAIPLFLNQRKKAYETRVKSDATDIIQHATSYRSEERRVGEERST